MCIIPCDGILHKCHTNKPVTSKHDEWLKYAERNGYEEDEKDWKAKAKDNNKDKVKTNR